MADVLLLALTVAGYLALQYQLTRLRRHYMATATDLADAITALEAAQASLLTDISTAVQALEAANTQPDLQPLIDRVKTLTAAQTTEDGTLKGLAPSPTLEPPPPPT